MTKLPFPPAAPPANPDADADPEGCPGLIELLLGLPPREETLSEVVWRPGRGVMEMLGLLFGRCDPPRLLTLWNQGRNVSLTQANSLFVDVRIYLYRH